MVPPFIRSVRRTVAAAAGIASLLGPGIAQAKDKCIDFDGDRKCAKYDDSTAVPTVDTSSGTSRGIPSLPPSEIVRDQQKQEPQRKEDPPPQKSPERKFVKHS